MIHEVERGRDDYQHKPGRRPCARGGFRTGEGRRLRRRRRARGEEAMRSRGSRGPWLRRDRSLDSTIAGGTGRTAGQREKTKKNKRKEKEKDMWWAGGNGIHAARIIKVFGYEWERQLYEKKLKIYLFFFLHNLRLYTSMASFAKIDLTRVAAMQERRASANLGHGTCARSSHARWRMRSCTLGMRHRGAPAHWACDITVVCRTGRHQLGPAECLCRTDFGPAHHSATYWKRGTALKLTPPKL